MASSWLFGAAAGLLLICESVVAQSSASAPTATLDSGVIFGTTAALPPSSTIVNQFLGVPFAAPPKRFAPPEKPEPWSEPFNATVKAGSCVQQFQYGPSRNLTIQFFNAPNPVESEDCLYLNVYAPATPAPPEGRAVLFWIYGGALQFGYGSNPVYDGSHFAAYEDVIVVTPNYRTNVFGFATTPELPLEGRNLGFLDQRAGLDWVQRNIKAFGGCPDKVTIFGESAGSWSVDALITSFPANSTPPFRGAIQQSGQISYRGTPAAGLQWPDTKSSWNTLAAALNCTGDATLECVRNAPVLSIRNIIEQQSLDFNPVYDNITLVPNPALNRLTGNIANVPLLTGSNAQEGRVLFTGANSTSQFLGGGFPDVAQDLRDAIEAAYPVGGSEFPTAYDAISAMVTDEAFQCGAAYVANDSASVGIPAWRYYFNASFPNTQIAPGLGVYHSSEIALVFSTYDYFNLLGSKTTAQEYALSNFMRGAWARFAKDPVAGPGWNAIGTGATFLDGAGDLDLGDLGSDGQSGVKVIQSSSVDGRCKVWEPVLKRGIQGAQ